MGDWNATCSLSHLPILPGEPVLAVPTSLNPFWEELGRPTCHPTDRYQPILPPACGLYNGFGSIEASTGFVMASESWMGAVEHLFSTGLLAGRNGCMTPPKSVTELFKALTYGGVVSLRKGQTFAVSCAFVKCGLWKHMMSLNELPGDVSELFSKLAPYYAREKRIEGESYAEIEELKDKLVGRLAGGGLLNSFLIESLRYYAKQDVDEGCSGFSALAMLTELLSQLRKTWEPFSGAGSCDEVTPAMISLLQWIRINHVVEQMD